MALQGQFFPCGEINATPYFCVQIGFKKHGIELGALCLDYAPHSEHTHIGDGVKFVGLEVFYKDEVLFRATIKFTIDGDFYLTFEDEKEVLQVRVNVFGTAVACLELEYGYLRDTATALIGREQYALESHFVGCSSRLYVL